MASLHQHPKSNNWSIAFRYGGKQYTKSLRTTNRKVAERHKGRIETLLDELVRGRRVLPDGADLWEYLQSDGTRGGKLEAPRKAATLSDLWDAYLSGQIGQKEENTLKTERIHRGHHERVIGPDTPVRSLTAATAQQYIKSRDADVKVQTIKKEVATLKMLLGRAGVLVGEQPTDVRELFRPLAFPKLTEKPPYATWAEIEAEIARTKPDAAGRKELWDRLFLDTEQIAEFLAWAEGRRTRREVQFMPPLLTAAAHTGARVGELTRSRLGDWDLGGRWLLVRELKRSQKGTTFRRVRVSQQLADRMRRWLADGHPGGELALCQTPGVRLTDTLANSAFRHFVRGSKWDVLHGYHTLRHSFASNLAHAGVDDRAIDEAMGHQTEEMRKRYRHLFPQKMADAIERVYG
jgi:integrase